MGAPEKIFRSGAVTAAVFLNEWEARDGLHQVRRVKLSRRYPAGFTDSMERRHIKDAIAVLRAAEQHLARMKADDDEDGADEE